MEIIIIAAMAKNHIIGKDNKLPWHIPEELQLFKKTTMGSPMIMGRKTFESFPAPLPGRRHIVLSRNKDYKPKGGELCHSLKDAIALCGDAEKAFIIGGAQIFTQGIDIATTILLTLLERDVDGDVFFPDFSEDDFSEVSRKTYPDAKEPFTVVTYTRKAEA
jgi:dihydrofolate reductase